MRQQNISYANIHKNKNNNTLKNTIKPTYTGFLQPCFTNMKQEYFERYNC